MVKLGICLCFGLLFNSVWSQNNAAARGTVVNAKTQIPIAGVVVSIQNTAQMQITNPDGSFQIQEIPAGKWYLLVRNQGYQDALFPIELAANQILDLGTIPLQEDQSFEQQSSIIALSESDFSDDNSSSENTAGLLQSTRDAFLQAAAFHWGQARFRTRGLDSEQAIMMINGLSMNKIIDGRPQWGDWGGLNDALRNQEFTIGTTPSDYTFGALLGTQEINTRASIYRPGTRLTFSGTNSNYNWRSMATHASGMSSSGWAYVVSASKRWAQEGYFEGTSYDANSFFVSIEKKLNQRHSLNLTAFYTPNTRAKNSPNTAEVTQLTSENYNSYWGFQNGKKRNARLKTVEEPIVMLQHFFKIKEQIQLNTTLMYQMGTITNSNIDFQNANSPDPAYYRKLPSFYSSLYAPDDGELSGAFTPDEDNAAKNKAAFLAQPQLDWKALYLANQTAVADSNGAITSYEPAQSKYVLYDDVVDDQVAAAATNLNAQLSDNISLNAAASYKKLFSRNYQKLTDLLGGKFYNDVDAFYNGDESQSDLNNPNRQVGVGDIYGYNFNYTAQTIDAFTQFKFNYNDVDFYVAQTYSNTVYQREGLYKNGLYPNSSFGKSETVHFENFGFKAGLIYKISGKQLLSFHAAHLSKAPALRNVFSNARLNNVVVPNVKSERNSSLELSYTYRSPLFKARATAYHTLQRDITQVSFFYAEGIFDDGAGYASTDAFVSQTLTGLNKKNTGAELSLEYQWTATFKTTLAGAFGLHTYASNPNVTLVNDAQAATTTENAQFDFGKAALTNYKQSGTPQRAYSFGCEYRDPKYWWLGSTINYLSHSFLDVSPIARTDIFYRNPSSGLTFPEATPERGRELLQQEQLDPIMLLNLVGGKSWIVKGKNLGVFFSVNNVLNQRFKTGGFEQARNANFRERNQDVSSGTPSFGPKYFYGYGRTYFVNFYINL
ncbi:carboxypeptidase-like regulatory domain-containing protein [Flavobacterium turcicum]|uniref:TonB-dependent receptor n=1 Tax=Flavobacterium turcicum TaxID=2764718 RepID=A0ABR7JC08_9FLAO|nr:carboxypeptidase-like regulatory domain-containing protein [Flavobacterium turcicum]MBC5862034.1 TonB-dependent receptor [Flavobacterium turcicum]NHL00765.1 TonB-dependent receptor [Flavobacterium turcicum]